MHISRLATDLKSVGLLQSPDSNCTFFLFFYFYRCFSFENCKCEHSYSEVAVVETRGHFHDESILIVFL